MSKSHALYTLASLSLALSSQAALKLPHIFSDHAVLQRDLPVTIWGWEDPGAKVNISFAGQSKAGTTGKDGKWSIVLDPLKTNKQGTELTITSSTGDKQILKDILVGEVWLAGGQSNMQWTIKQARKEDQAVAQEKTRPLIRIATIPKIAKYEPQDDVKTKWEISTPEVAMRSTAVGWFFAKNLVDELDIPVGIISSNWGGSKIETWITDDGYQATPYLQELYKQRQTRIPGTPAYEALLKASKDSGKKSPPAMKPGNHTTGLYQAMIHPLLPYGLRGFIWYQGESNRGESYTYMDKKKGLIEGWRKAFQRPDAPFYFVQLAPFIYGKNKPSDLAMTRQAQLETLKLPNTGMAVTMDVGNLKNIHPTNKSTVGHRLALWALAKDYGKKDLVYSGPLFKSAKADGNKVIVNFEHADGLKTTDVSAPKFLEIAGSDNQWHPATGTIKGSHLIVTSKEVSNPTQVRYAWSHDALPNLINGSGLPASPFHSNFPPRK
ncbi:hypothetical protein Rhal01_01290 [Rubritalea halochordaticola]|uniref:Sialate O-acetylesterase domain-containing protein n=1 Tax=Rubritalea halochordaticola TaxID=714537 RepID=A0ABP9UXZ4_9BACT